MTPESFKKIPVVLEALKQPQSSRSILNYMFACDTANPEDRSKLNYEDSSYSCASSFQTYKSA